MCIPTVDLHGVKHENVRNEVVRFVEANWGQDCCGDIITGLSVKMKAIVRGILDEYQLGYYLYAGCITVKFSDT